MPRSLPTTLATFLVLLALLPGAPAEPASESLVANGGFEADADGDGMPDGWTPSGGGFGSARSLELAIARPFEMGGVESDPVPVAPGDHLRLALQGRFLPFPTGDSLESSPASQPSVGVRFRDARGYELTRFETAFPNGRTWWGAEVESVVPPGAAHAVVVVRVRGPGVFHVDDVRLVAYHDPNPVPNPGFETGLHGPNGWWTCAGQWDDEGSEGRRSLFLDPWAPCGPGAASVPFVLAPGAYELSVDRILRGTGAPVQVKVRLEDASGAILARPSWSMEGSDGTWRTARLTFCAPPQTAAASLLLGGADLFSGAVSWDDVRLVRAGDCPPG